MKKQMKLSALLLCAVMLAGWIAGCKAPVKTLTEEDKNRIQTRLSAMMTDRGFSGAVYAVYQGEEIFDGGAGMATADEVCTTETAFGVASLTKQFTAASIMQLYEAGQLDLKDTLRKYFSDYQYCDDITVEQLLYQRSGIPDYSVDNRNGKVVVSCDGSEERGIVISDKATAEENRRVIREFFLSKELLFEPGKRFDYSDANYALLAEIVAQVSGMEYHEYVRQHIFEPLGMEHSAFIDDFDDSIGATVAQPDLSEFKKDYYPYKGVEYGCGDILTTPKDLYRWYRGIMAGEVVGEDSLKVMTKNYSSADELGYGYGLMINDEGDTKVIYHYGYIPSFYSAVFYVPEYDFFLTVLSNTPDGSPQGMAADMAVYLGSAIGLKLVGID